ncbi:hypothetical protein D3C84_500550 [compost metagenome]
MECQSTSQWLTHLREQARSYKGPCFRHKKGAHSMRPLFRCSSQSERRHHRAFVLLENEGLHFRAVQGSHQFLHRIGVLVVWTGNEDVHVRQVAKLTVHSWQNPALSESQFQQPSGGVGGRNSDVGQLSKSSAHSSDRKITRLLTAEIWW